MAITFKNDYYERCWPRSLFPQKTNFYIYFQKLLSKITLRRTYIPPLEEDEGGGHVPHFFDNATNTRSNSLETGAFNSIFWYVCG